MQEEPRVCLAAVLSELHPESMVRAALEHLARAAGRVRLVEAGVFYRAHDLARALQGCRGAAVLVGSGGTEHTVLRGLERYRGPVLLASYDGHNSLPAALEVLPALREAGVRVYPAHFRLGEARNRRLEAGLQALWAASRLRGARVGVIGGPSDWLVYSRMDRRLVESLGFELVEISVSRVVERYYEVDREEAGRLARMFSGRASQQVRGEGLEKAVAIYMAIKSVVVEEGLDAFTIRCWDLIPVLKATPCLALALLNSEGVVAGCEGDLPALLTMMMASSISREPAYMGNIADLDENKILIAHCTAPLRIGPYTITTHFETGQPVGVTVTFPSGRPATVARLHPKEPRLTIARGQILASRPRPRFCRTQVAVKLEGGTSWILDESTGNHHVLAIGDIALELEALAHMMGLEPIVR